MYSSDEEMKNAEKDLEELQRRLAQPETNATGKSGKRRQRKTTNTIYNTVPGSGHLSLLSIFFFSSHKQSLFNNLDLIFLQTPGRDIHSDLDRSLLRAHLLLPRVTILQVEFIRKALNGKEI